MKRLILCFFLFPSILFIKAQVTTTTNPAIVIQQSGVGVTVTFDVSQMSSLAGNAGPLYVHAGVLTTASAGTGDWKYVITPWPNGANSATANIPANTLTSVSSNKWQLTITPDINTFCGITAGDVVTNLAFVVRNADGSKQSSPDIFIPVYQPGLNVAVTAPVNNSIIPVNTAATISASALNAGQSCPINIYVGATTVSNITDTTPIASGTDSLSTSYTFINPGYYYIIAQTTSGSSTKSDTSYVCVSPPPSATPVPASAKEGININSDGTVTLLLSLRAVSPISTSTPVFVLGDFNNFQIDTAYMMKAPMVTKYGGYAFVNYWITLKNLDPDKEYAFQYLVAAAGSSIKIGDPYCEKILDPNNDKYISQTYTIYPNLKPYPSEAKDILSCFQINAPAYQWQTTGFTPPEQNKLQIYEMLFRDFTTEGSVQAAIGKLDYLKELGVNAVELMPIMEFDGNSSWGYNPNYYFAPDKAYGTKQDYQQFVDECHKRGIAVILDIVFNHTWGLSPYCKLWWDATNNRPSAANPYYNALAPHPYSVGNDINHSALWTRAWLTGVLSFWLKEYKVDGFRFDLSKGFTQTVSNGGAVNPNASIQCEATDPSRIGYIKEYADTVKAVNPNAYIILEHFCNDSEENTLAAYDGMMLWRNVNNAFCQAAMGYSSQSDFSGLVSTGGSLTLPANRVAYAESHDEYRMGYKAITWGIPQVQDTTNVMQQLAVCGAFVFLNPGPRMMWEFGELGADYASKDASGNNITDPVSAQWNNLNIPARKQLHDVYAKILNFRQQYSSVFDNPAAWDWQVSTSDWNNGRRIYLQKNDTVVVILGNFTAIGSITSSPAFGKTGTWYEVISGDSLIVTDPNMTLTLNPFDIRVYTNKSVYTNMPAVTNSLVKVYPNPVIDNLFISSGTAKTIEVTSVAGALVLNQPVNGNAVSLTSLPQGIYIGRITFSDGSLKIVKINKK